MFSSEALAKVYFTSPTRGEGKSHLERDVGCVPLPRWEGMGRVKMNEGNKFSLNIYNHYVVFRLDERQFALNLHSVERVVRAVAVTSLPKAPEIVLGVINIHGQIIPVLDIRKLFHLPEKRINLNDQFILVKTRSRTIAILANEVSSVVERSEQEVITEKDMLPDIEHIEGAIKLEDGTISMIIMQDFDKFLALERAPTPDSAIQENIG